MVLTVYHDLNVAKNLGQNKLYHIKLRLLQMLLILIMKNFLSLHPNSSAIKCAFLRDKKIILLLLIL